MCVACMYKSSNLHSPNCAHYSEAGDHHCSCPCLCVETLDWVNHTGKCICLAAFYDNMPSTSRPNWVIWGCLHFFHLELAWKEQNYPAQSDYQLCSNKNPSSFTPEERRGGFVLDLKKKKRNNQQKYLPIPPPPMPASSKGTGQASINLAEYHV